MVAAIIDDEHPECPKPPKKKKKMTGPLLTKDEICISNGVEEVDQSESVESTKKEDNQAVVNIDGEYPECPKPSKKKKKMKGPILTKEEICISNGVEEEDHSESVEPTKKEEPPGTGFTILEEFKVNKNNKVFRVLPTWLAKPSVISCDLSNNKMPITGLNGLDKFLHDALKRNKIEYFFPGNYFCSLVKGHW